MILMGLAEARERLELLLQQLPVALWAGLLRILLFQVLVRFQFQLLVRFQFQVLVRFQFQVLVRFQFQARGLVLELELELVLG